MIIANIEVFPLRVPLKQAEPSEASAWGDQDLPVLDSVLVKIAPDDGVGGWGEAFGFRAGPSVNRRSRISPAASGAIRCVKQ